jgi:hypothetical protein
MTSDSPQASSHWSIAQHHEALTTSSQDDADQTVPATCDEPILAAAITPTASPREPTATAFIASALAADEPAAADLPTTSSDESSASDAAASLKSLDAPAVTDAVTPTTSFDEPALTDAAMPNTSFDELPTAASSEAPLSSDAEGALEMIRMTLAMNFNDTNHHTVTDIAMQMRKHLIGLRKKGPRTRSLFRYSSAARFEDGWKHQQ